MKYKYFMSYNHQKGYGNAIITTPKKIKTFSDIEKVESKLEEDSDIKDVRIIFYKLV